MKYFLLLTILIFINGCATLFSTSEISKEEKWQRINSWQYSQPNPWWEIYKDNLE